MVHIFADDDTIVITQEFEEEINIQMRNVNKIELQEDGSKIIIYHSGQECHICPDNNELAELAYQYLIKYYHSFLNNEIRN